MQQKFGRWLDLREHDVQHDPRTPTVCRHTDVTAVFMFKRENTLRWKVRNCATDVEGLLICFWPGESKVCDLDAWV